MSAASITSGQPRALPLLVFTNMWVCFSYYGMRVLLILYMVQELGMHDAKAFAIYAVYTCLVEIGGIWGGVLADRFLGLRRTILLGGWGIAVGHVCLTIASIPQLFYIGLGLIVVGTSLFTANINALLGTYYSEDDPRRESGFTLFYMGINLGGLLAGIFCSFAAQYWGWHYGFGLAAIGMFIGNFTFMLGQKHLEEKRIKKNHSFARSYLVAFAMIPAAVVCAYVIGAAETTLSGLPMILVFGIAYIIWQVHLMEMPRKGAVWALFAYVLLLALFFAIEEQIGSSLILFVERHVDTTIAGFVIPPASLSTMNPLVIILLGPILSRYLQKYALSASLKMSVAFCSLAWAFVIIYIACQQIGEDAYVPIAYVLMSFAIIAVAELFMGPTVYAYCSEVSPPKLRGSLMGLVSLGFAGANVISGYLSQMMAITEHNESLSLDVYMQGYALIASLALALGILILLFNRLVRGVPA